MEDLFLANKDDEDGKAYEDVISVSDAPYFGCFWVAGGDHLQDPVNTHNGEQFNVEKKPGIVERISFISLYICNV